MSFSTIYAYIVYYPLELFEYIKSALTSLFFSSNIYFYLSATDYGSETHCLYLIAYLEFRY